MPIISKVEAKSRQGRVINAAILIFLSLGAVTMLYPFLIMVSGTFRSEIDETELNLVPEYLVDTTALYRKFLETKYNQNVQLMNRAHGTMHFGFNHKTILPPKTVPRQINDLARFFHEFSHWPRHWDLLGASRGVKTIPENLRRLTTRLRHRYQNDLSAINVDLGTVLVNWDFRRFMPPNWISARYDFDPNVIYNEFFAIEDGSHPTERQLVSVSNYFVEVMILPIYGVMDPTKYNDAHVVDIDQYVGYLLPPKAPDSHQPTLRKEWIEFVTKELNVSFINLDDVPDITYQDYLKGKYGDIPALNQSWNARHESFQEILLPRRRWLSGTERNDYTDFLAQQPIERYRLDAPEYAWRHWLEAEYGSVNKLNAAHHTAYTDFNQALVPIAQSEWQYIQNNTWRLRWTYAARNYINVFDAMIVRGRAFVNTIILCLLSILTALLVNPLAAYAMSRFHLPGTYKFLLLLMATMSFPPMVTMIPMFVMLREMHLLNSFWALVLPFAANGYMIFLLKGFFDSLPPDLYEAALIDGASEIRMFFQITMALSQPILAVVALGAFTAAYTMFMYALIVCPKEEMWLLSVYLFQYQKEVSMGGMFAAVLLAAIPPLIIFLFAQNIIMRGIVVPVEK